MNLTHGRLGFHSSVNVVHLTLSIGTKAYNITQSYGLQGDFDPSINCFQYLLALLLIEPP